MKMTIERRPLEGVRGYNDGTVATIKVIRECDARQKEKGATAEERLKHLHDFMNALDLVARSHGGLAPL